MKVVRATFEQIYFTGYQYLNQRLGGEVLLEEGETLEDGWNKLKKDADEMHKKNYPHLYESGLKIEINPEYAHHLSPTPIPDVQVEKTPKEQMVEAFISTIGFCTNVTMLEKFRKGVEREDDERLTLAFENKLQSLQK